MRRLGSGGGRGPLGQLDKVLLIGLGLLIVVAARFASPFGGDRPAVSAGASAAATATPSRAATASTPTPAAAANAPSTAPSPTPQLADPPWFRVVAGGDGANLRNAPSTNAPVVKRIRDGTVITNLDEQRTADGLSWRRVAEGDVDGWIAAELLVPQRE